MSLLAYFTESQKSSSHLPLFHPVSVPFNLNWQHFCCSNIFKTFVGLQLKRGPLSLQKRESSTDLSWRNLSLFLTSVEMFESMHHTCNLFSKWVSTIPLMFSIEHAFLHFAAWISCEFSKSSYFYIFFS